jgi:ATP-dependent helicase/nuclease subunit A
VTTSPHIVVRASAGTGKTYRLTIEIIRLLAAGADPGTILATTFTRKAAGQILGRTFELLGKAAGSDEELERLRLAIPALTRPRCIDLTVALASNIHRLNILTLDAFFARLASGFALECGLPPGWKIMSEEELERATSDAVTDSLSQPIPGLNGLDRRLGLAMALHKGGAGRGVHSDALRAVTSAQFCLGEAVEDAVWEVIGPQRAPLALPELTALVEELVREPLPLTKSLQPNKKWQAAIADIASLVVRGEWDVLLGKGIVGRIADGGSEFNGAEIPQGIRDRLEPLISHAAAVESATLRDRNISTGVLLSHFSAALQRRKQSEGRYFFDDFPQMLLNAGATGRLTDLYYRLDASIRHLLLDEFQDTSLTQFRLLEPIIDELAASNDGSVFCVGDPKQSLYAWRGGRAELLLRLRDRWSQFQDQSLDVNRRSSPVVIQAVNDVFADLGSNAALADQRPASIAWSARFPRHEAHQQGLTGLVRLWDPSAEGPAGEGGSSAIDELQFAARRVKDIAETHPGFSIGVLVRTNKPIPRLLRELDRLGLRASKEGGVPLLASPPAAAAAGLLHLADHPGDTAALFLVASGPLGRAVSLTDPHDLTNAIRVASRIRRDLLEQGYAQVIAGWLRKISSELDAYAFERFERLIDLAHEFDASGGGLHPSDLARVIRDRAVDDPSADRIRVMTIHRAKGLEFDAVVLPQLGYGWSLRNSILVDRRDGSDNPDPLGRITAASWSGSKELRRVNAPLQALYERTRSAQTEEELCTLYVAMTRPRRILEMVLPAEPRDGLSAATILRNALSPGGEPRADGLLHEAGEPPSGQPAAVPPAPEPPSITITVTAADPPAHRWATRAPSSRTGRLSISELFAVRSAALDRGTLLHAWFEQVQWLDEHQPTDEDLGSLPMVARLPVPVPPDALAAFRSATGPNCPTGRLLRRAEYVARPADALQLKREWAFATPGPRAGTLVAGRFDRVVIGLIAGRPAWAEVIDFKTDAVGADIRSAARHHEPQMRAYRDALCKLLGLDRSVVTAVVAFTGPGEVVRFRSRPQ